MPASNPLKRKSFADLHLITKDHSFFIIGVNMKIKQHLYDEESPKFPLSVNMALDNVGISSKRLFQRLFHNELGTEYVECSFADVLVSEVNRKPVPYPSWWVEKYGNVCKEERLTAFILPAERLANPCYTSTRVNLSDTDFNKHTNTAAYVKFCYESIFENVSDNKYKNIKHNHFYCGVKSVSVRYTNQSGLHDELDITSWQDTLDGNTIYTGVAKKGGKSCCQMKIEFYNDKLQSNLWLFNVIYRLIHLGLVDF